MEGPDASFDAERVLGPVDTAVFFFDRRRIRHLALILRSGDEPAVLEQLQGLVERLGAEHGQCVVQAATGFGFGDGTGFLQQNIARVQVLIDLHDGDAGLPLAIGNRPLNGRRPPVLGQQRSVDIDAAVGRQVEQTRGQQLAVGRNHQQVGLPVAQPGHDLGRAQLGGLKNRNIVFEGAGFDRRGT